MTKVNLKKKFKGFYPKLALRILFYLRKIRPKKKFVYTEELITFFNKPRSTISKNVTILNNYDLVSKVYDVNSNNMKPYLKISITEKGLSLVNGILYEILFDEEIGKLDSQIN